MKKNNLFFKGLWIFLSMMLFASHASAQRRITLKMAKQIYIDTCSVCHGENGDGRTHAANALKPRPRNFRAGRAQKDLTKIKMLKTVADGSPGTAMIAWKYNLTQAEIKAVVIYIRASFMKMGTYPEGGIIDPKESMALMKSHNHQGAQDHKQHSGNKLSLEDKKPDIIEGKKIYLENCFPCHGKKGDGKGPRYRFIDPPPRKFTDMYDMKGISKERMIVSVTKGRVGSQMMAWEGILTPHQIDSVVEYVWTEFVKKGK